MPLSQSLSSTGFSINTNDVILRQTCTTCVSATRNWNRRMKIQVPILKFSRLDSLALHTLFWTHDKQHVLGSQHYSDWLWSQPEYTQHLCEAPENISLSVVKDQQFWGTGRARKWFEQHWKTRKQKSWFFFLKSIYTTIITLAPGRINQKLHTFHLPQQMRWGLGPIQQPSLPWTRSLLHWQ